MTEVGESVAVGLGDPGKDAEPKRGKLRVKAVSQCDDSALKDVEVIVKIDGEKKKKTTNGSGVADFGEVLASSYVVKLKARYEKADYFLILVHYPRVTWKKKAIVEVVDTAVVPDDGEVELVVKMKVYRVVSTIKFKRQQLALNVVQSIRTRQLAADYGHWWTELGGGESYGWWPSQGLDLASTFRGVPGALNGFVNGRCRFGNACSPTQDPHDGDVGEQEFSPVIDDCRSDNDLKEIIRGIARSYSGEWSWRFEFGNHCHTMQKKIISGVRACGFRDL